MAYRLLPSQLVKPFALALPAVEAMAGVALILATGEAWPLVLATALLIVFSAAVLRSVALDRKHYCGGCWGFSTRDVSVVRWQLVYRNAVLILLLAAADLLEGGPASGVLVAVSSLWLAGVLLCHALKQIRLNAAERGAGRPSVDPSSVPAETPLVNNIGGDAG
jgi:hypothetical protein